MEQPTRRWICFAFDYECTAEKPDDHPLHAECGWWQPLPADRDQGNTNSQHLPVDAELGVRDRGGCPWIITGDEGTSHCSLAERGGSDLERLRSLLADYDALPPLDPMADDGEFREWDEMVDAAMHAVVVAARSYLARPAAASPATPDDEQ